MRESNTRKPNINDVARVAGVSKKTVSRVINKSPLVAPDTLEKVEAAIAKLGFVPDPQARGLATSSSSLFGLVYDNPNAQYVSEIMIGALNVCRPAGYEVVMHICDADSPRFAEDVGRFVEQTKLDGVLVLPPISERTDLIEVLKKVECHYVRIAPVSLDHPRSMIVHNDRIAAARMARHLHSLGHRRIGVIKGPNESQTASERFEGFTQELAESGIEIDSSLVMQGDYGFESGIECARQLLDGGMERPTAIFACNDEMASGVYKAAFHLGITIPDELSVAGYDDVLISSRLSPAMTTIRLPIAEMGELAAKKLIAANRPSEDLGNDAVFSVVFEPRFIKRESTGAPRRSS